MHGNRNERPRALADHGKRIQEALLRRMCRASRAKLRVALQRSRVDVDGQRVDALNRGALRLRLRRRGHATRPPVATKECATLRVSGRHLARDGHHPTLPRVQAIDGLRGLQQVPHHGLLRGREVAQVGAHQNGLDLPVLLGDEPEPRVRGGRLLGDGALGDARHDLRKGRRGVVKQERADLALRRLAVAVLVIFPEDRLASRECRGIEALALDLRGRCRGRLRMRDAHRARSGARGRQRRLGALCRACAEKCGKDDGSGARAHVAHGSRTRRPAQGLQQGARGSWG